MAKTKRKHLAAIAAMKESRPLHITERGQTTHYGQVAESSTLLTFDDKDPWVEVRKQRVIILIPPLPTTQQGPSKLKQRRKEKLPEAASPTSDAKVVKVFVTRRKRESGKRTDQTKINMNLSKVVLTLGDCRREKAMNKSCSLEEVPNDSTALRVSEENAGVQHSTDVPAVCKASSIEAGSQSSTFVDVRELRHKRKWKDHSSSKNSLNRTRRRRNLERLPTQENFQAVVPSMSSMEVLLASVETINTEQTTRLDVASHNAAHDPGESHDVIETNVDIGQEVLTLDVRRSLQQNVTPEADDVKPCLDVEDSNAMQKHSPSVVPPEPATSICRPAQPTLPRIAESSFQARGSFSSTSLSLSDNKADKNVMMNNRGNLSDNANGRLPPSGPVYAGAEVLGTSCQLYPSLSTNQAVRALTLKKQLEKAGGLSKWLFSVGLEQFVKVFEKQMLNEVELLQLTMDDLKKMGATAVGPRRKLIWAINHLCQQLIY